MKIFVKNMVCGRCIAAVTDIFRDEGIETETVRLGEVETRVDLTDAGLRLIDRKLEATGFERITDQAHQLTEKVKTLLIEKISGLDIEENFILSEFLGAHLHRAYSSVSKTFSQHEAVTLEQFFILQKIEKVKELLLYDELTVTEIAGKLGYRSVQHLSSQFRSTTGFTPTTFKKLKVHHRKALDEV